jgi:hypothetical protein
VGASLKIRAFNSASEKKANRPEDGFTAAERCAKRLARQSEAERERERDARDNRDLTLGEQVIRNPLTSVLTRRTTAHMNHKCSPKVILVNTC